ncbi:ComEC/Rec2 family competence protein [Anaerosacchariphilus polymeriproducens]|uniref:MBL fold metallo-hydrolase n=1 Tax=Anaerosacchariphilus polymeriproducens TaxID=1812858 RepID=A0A371ATQ5_9FIRM|nr:MBL fold metallo-hydrolase [Anaerosacchariphilus polymeriproducens]RDU22957.1 MBL fold metallo-hydrolase [Anaerosacchariphilus polymeriproducens]
MKILQFERYKFLICIIAILTIFQTSLNVKAAAIKSKKDSMAAFSAIITQYGNPAGRQSTFYTIETKSRGLIVVDGGWGYDAAKVRKIIIKKGKVVDAWIITHPHPDHVGAFNEIYSNKNGIKIKKIFTVKMNELKYKKYAKPWDEYEVFQKFNNLIAGSSKVRYLKAGDSFRIKGLDFKVFNAYASYVSKYTKDLCNGGSLMFKVIGRKQSMLFCADVGSTFSDYLLKKYGNELKSDYLQVGHHGNGGLRKSFYKKVRPRKAYFDSPNWLMENKDQYSGEKANYKTKKTIRCLKRLGAKIYSFKTSPNKIILK